MHSTVLKEEHQKTHEFLLFPRFPQLAVTAEFKCPEKTS